MAELNGLRAARARAYFDDPKNMHQLGVLTILLDVCDRLLYKLLGDVDRKAPPAKIPALLDQQTTPIGQVLSELSRLLDEWLVGGALRRPWCDVDMLNALVLRMSAALCRRYEWKYSTRPYKLINVCNPQWGCGTAESTASEAVGERECCLDVFSRGARAEFRTAEAIQSDRCKAILASSFDGLRATTDWCERQTAEVQALRKYRGRGLDFTNFARENVLKQTRVAHLRAVEDKILPSRAR